MVREITLNHICKIEGHAHLSLKIEKNKVIECQLKAAEGARFFEALVLGKKVEDVQEIVSRICGICSSAHSVACIQALENALDLKPSEKQKITREMLMIGERIRSNATHLYFLVLPDYYHLSSALELGQKHKDKLDDAVKLISLGNKIVEAFGGREIHPFIKIKENVNEFNFALLLTQLENSKELLKKTAFLFISLDYPKLERETDYLSLRDKEYSLISGKIISKSGLINQEDYKKHITESIKEYATSKFALKNGKVFQVGAMARINNNYDQLDQETKELFSSLKTPLNNPFQNNIAQAVELFYLTKHAINLIKRFEKLPEEKNSFKIKAGHGVSAVEAPRGTLFHEYEIGRDGKISFCNILTPTVQNLAMMELDIKNLVEVFLKQGKTKEQIILDIEKLIRAYDPCFSCSTHFLEVDWKEY